ncbi:MAG TPA: 7-cyano-7-deazaguanine synthase QueC [bacterium]|nr:7-cyano-7-deazaguanine synthase QueC [bacterium]
MNAAIALLSGGLDSAVSVAIAARELRVVSALTFDYGQRAARQEISAASSLASGLGIPHRVIELPWLAEATTTALVNTGAEVPRILPEELCRGGQERAAAVWVPNRNGLFVAIAAAIAEGLSATRIVAGFNAEEAESFPDNSDGFVEASNLSLSFSTKNRVSLSCPVLYMSKSEIAAEALKLNLSTSSFWSCYLGGERMCGECESCARTIRAFEGTVAWAALKDRFETFAGRPA